MHAPSGNHGCPSRATPWVPAAYLPLTPWPWTLPLAQDSDTLRTLCLQMQADSWRTARPLPASLAQDGPADRQEHLCITSPCKCPPRTSEGPGQPMPGYCCPPPLSLKPSSPHNPPNVLPHPHPPSPALLWALACWRGKQPVLPEGSGAGQPDGCGWCLTAFLLEKYGVKNCVGLIRQPAGPDWLPSA